MEECDTILCIMIIAYNFYKIATELQMNFTAILQRFSNLNIQIFSILFFYSIQSNSIRMKERNKKNHFVCLLLFVYSIHTCSLIFFSRLIKNHTYLKYITSTVCITTTIVQKLCVLFYMELLYS